MSTLRIAQLASYRGNLGDNANVIGTRRMLAENLGVSIDYTNLEYLEYEPDPRWGGKRFDESFARVANEHDLLLIGGGGFWELACDNHTGTPLDFSPAILDQIRTPMVFYALGLDLSYGVDTERASRFREFLRYLEQRDDVLISLRNDGSLANLKSVLAGAASPPVDRVPDGGFFARCQAHDHIELPEDAEIVAINLAGDRPDYRYRTPSQTVKRPDRLTRLWRKIRPAPPARNWRDNYTQFIDQLASVLRDRLQSRSRLHAVLVPHIPEDLPPLYDLMQRVGPPYCRSRMSVAPYAPGHAGAEYILDLYQRADVVLGMRFHANVCPMGLGVPTIGLVTHPQIEYLYGELNLPDRALRHDSPQFGDSLAQLLDGDLANPEPVRRRYASLCREMRGEVDHFHEKIAALLGGGSHQPSSPAFCNAAVA